MCFRPPSVKKVLEPCPQCGKDKDPEVVCPHCGYVPEIFCPKCGTKNPVTNEQCANCGFKPPKKAPPPGQAGGLKTPPPPVRPGGVPAPRVPPAPPKVPPAPPKKPGG